MQKLFLALFIIQFATITQAGKSRRHKRKREDNSSSRCVKKLKHNPVITNLTQALENITEWNVRISNDNTKLQYSDPNDGEAYHSSIPFKMIASTLQSAFNKKNQNDLVGTYLQGNDLSDDMQALAPAHKKRILSHREHMINSLYIEDLYAVEQAIKYLKRCDEEWYGSNDE